MTDERRELDALYARYIEVVDDGPLSAWPNLFTEGCSYRIASRENVRRGLPLAAVRCDSRASLRDRVRAIESTAFYVQRQMRHVVGHLDVRTDDGVYIVRSSFSVFQSLPRSATELFCVGTSDDVVVREQGHLRFDQRHCTYDGDLVTDSFVYPL